jgi:two-component system CheB/CheR fusion protein
MADELRASIAEAWWVDEDSAQLSFRHLYVSTQLNSAFVAQKLEQAENRSSEGLKVQSLRSKRAIWCTNQSESDSFLKSQAAKELELLSTLIVPIASGSTVLGVLSFYSRERPFVDNWLLHNLENLGRSIGEFVRSTESEHIEKRLAAITANSHDAILVYTSDGTISEWLDGAVRLFGYSAAEMVGETVERMIPPELIEYHRAIVDRVRRGESVEPFETTRICKDGSRVFVSVRISPIRNPNGEVIGISATDRDITDLKETERRLLEADRQKNVFIAMLGHELRNPLSAICAASGILRVAGDDSENIERAERILERQTAHMTRLLDGILDLSRIIQGKIELKKEVVDLAETCRAVAEDVEYRTRDRDLSFEYELPNEPIWIEGDNVRLAQIVDNILSNAVKYSKDGASILLELKTSNQVAVLRVMDNGSGITPELLPHVFELFKQSDKSMDRAFGGLGIGLTLVRALTELHGGTATAFSEGQDKGAELRIELPTTLKVPTGSQPSNGEPLGTLRVLVIEDNRDAADALQLVLELNGHDVLVCYDGPSGLSVAKQHQPDIVLCDLGLPEMSGFEVARAFRASRRLKKTRLIAMTGYGRAEDRARCLESGFDAHMTKPVDLDELHKMFALWFRSPENEESPSVNSAKVRRKTSQ